MRNLQKLTLLFLTVLVSAGVIALTTRSSQGSAPDKKTVKVLRKKDQLGLKPTAQEIAAQEVPQEEREFKDTVPKHVPIKVKLRNEQSFKNTKNKKWARELEIEIKNTGTKPIYFMYLLLVLTDVTTGGYPYAMKLDYGRKDLLRLYTPLQPDDVPIRPGETITLKISESQVKSYEDWRDEEGRDDPKKVDFDLQLINFGDGTGLHGTDGRPSPDPDRKRSSNAPDVKERLEASPLAARDQGANSCYKPASFSPSLEPANFTRVHFSLADKISTFSSASSAADFCGCQNNYDCFFGTLEYATCPCDDPEEFTAFILTSCSDGRGNCSQTKIVNRSCNTQYNGKQFCQFQEEGASCRETTPTPTPTPNGSPSPTPSPTPTPQCAVNCAACNPNSYCETRFPSFPFCVNPVPCASGPEVDLCTYPQSGGCPGNAYNDGSGGCCKCVNQNPTCDNGYQWDINRCECVPVLVTPTPTPTPGGGGTPPPGPCTECYWVSYESYDGGETWYEVDRQYVGCW
jgi:hypothetical protein